MKTNNTAMKQILMEAEKEINKFYNSKNFLAAIITGEEKNYLLICIPKKI